MSFMNSFGSMLNNAAYGNNNPSNPNGPQDPNSVKNRTLLNAVPATQLQAYKGVNPNVPPGAFGTGVTTPDVTQGSGNQNPQTQQGNSGMSYDFRQSPLKNGFDYLGQQFSNLTASKPAQPQSTNPKGQNGAMAPTDSSVGKKAAESMF